MAVFVAKIAVALIAIYLIGLGAIGMARADVAKQYLLAHAASPFRHYLELFIRVVCGWAILTMSPYMLAPEIFNIVGWVILITTTVLLVLPWQVHSRFSKWAVPQAIQYMKLIAIGSMVGGLIVAYSLFSGSVIEPAAFISGTAA